jgi:ADP-ribosylglycohydrolase
MTGNVAAMQHSLEGLALGDAFGQQFFRDADFIQPLIDLRKPPPGNWHWTDDTAMALGVVEILTRQGHADQDALAEVFSRNYMLEPSRGYGAGQHRLMQEIANGVDWREGRHRLFGGMGSLGNGAAMRIAPLGAYFAADLKHVAEQAERASEVTHAHPEGIAGGIAIAIAAALASRIEGTAPGKFIGMVRDWTPPGRVRDGLDSAADLDVGASVPFAAGRLGNGSLIQAHDTVPLCVWLAARNLGSFEDAMWETVSALGDRDTTCAIVGGIIAADTHVELPPSWIGSREPIP